jgi:uncharacterized protein YwqG
MGKVPDYLKEFETDLLKYKLDSIKIKAIPLREGESLNFTQSKFLGKPYLPIGIDYPKDKDMNIKTIKDENNRRY